MKLTQKEERYTQGLFIGKSQREAYKYAGYSMNQLPETIDANACRLAKDSKVIARLEELNEGTETENVASVLERKEVLTKDIRDNHKDRYGIPIKGPRLQAIDILNKMEGSYAPDRHELTGRDGSPLEIDTRELLIARIESIINRREDSDNTPDIIEGEVKDV